MKKEQWEKAASDLLEKCLLPEEDRKKIMTGLSSAKYLRDLAERRMKGENAKCINEIWKDLSNTANDAIAQLVIIASSGKLVLDINPKSGKFKFLTKDLPVEKELKILTENKIEKTRAS